MSYLDLCLRVYSHIQSKDIREYYINEILPNHNIEINEKLLDSLSFGKITVNKQ